MTTEILTGPERRRRWSTEEKTRIIGEMKAPGARVADIARHHGISRSLLYTWRRELGGAASPDLIPVVIEAPDGPATRRPGITNSKAAGAPDGSIEIALAGDVRVIVRGRVDPKGLRAVLAALRSA
jgi:transposase